MYDRRTTFSFEPYPNVLLVEAHVLPQLDAREAVRAAQPSPLVYPTLGYLQPARNIVDGEQIIHGVALGSSPSHVPRLPPPDHLAVGDRVHLVDDRMTVPHSPEALQQHDWKPVMQPAVPRRQTARESREGWRTGDFTDFTDYR